MTQPLDAKPRAVANSPAVDMVVGGTDPGHGSSSRTTYMITTSPALAETTIFTLLFTIPSNSLPISTTFVMHISH